MYTTSMFQSIKNALAKDDTGGSSYKDIMKLEVGKTYTVRLLPNSKSPENTFFHYFLNGWQSFATGQFVSAVSLQSFNERDPIQEERYRILRLGTDAEKKKAEKVNRSEKWMVNAYVIDDPTNPANNGSVKIIRYGRQLAKIIDEAIDGEDASEFGPRIFDLSKEGVNLKIKVEKQGEYPSYVSSRFTSPQDLGLTESKQRELYDSVHDLKKIVGIKTADELRELWNEHFLCTCTTSSALAPVAQELDPVLSEPATVTKTTTASVKSEDGGNDILDDETVKELLKGLE
jgi:hypothetical protein